MTDITAKLAARLEALLGHYLSLASSGDCGFWNPEEEDEVKATRETLTAYTASQSEPEFGPLDPASQNLGTWEPSADRLAALSAELDAVRGKLAGVDEKVLEACARAIWAADGLDRNDDNGWHGQAASESTRDMVRAEARAAITAYLAAAGGGGE